MKLQINITIPNLTILFILRIGTKTKKQEIHIHRFTQIKDTDLRRLEDVVEGLKVKCQMSESLIE